MHACETEDTVLPDIHSPELLGLDKAEWGTVCATEQSTVYLGFCRLSVYNAYR